MMDRSPLQVAVISPREMIKFGVQALLVRGPHHVSVVDLEADVTTGFADVVVVDEAALDSTDARTAGVWLSSARAVVLLTVEDDLVSVDRAVDEGVVAAVVAADATSTDLLATIEAAAAGSPPPSSLSPSPYVPWGMSQRESEVLRLIVEGKTNVEISEHLHVSINTVKTYIRTAYRKIGVQRRTQAVRWGLEHGSPFHREPAEPTG